MTYEEIVKKAEKVAGKIDKSAIEEHTAIEINIEGEGEGAFYVELDKDKIDVQPYEYYDCDCRIRGDVEVITDLIDGKLDATAAYLQGQLRIEGDFTKALTFYDAIKATEIKKAPAIKKTTVPKKTTKKKPAAKATEKKD